MAMKETDFAGAVPVDGYGPGFFRVGGRLHHGTAAGPRPWGGLDDIAALEALGGAVDVLFLGMGADPARPPAALSQALAAAGLAVEPTATPTGARSYNVTLSEGRRVACALLPV